MDTILTALPWAPTLLRQAAQWEAPPKTGSAHPEHKQDGKVGNKRKEKVQREKMFVECSQRSNLLH